MSTLGKSQQLSNVNLWVISDLLVIPDQIATQLTSLSEPLAPDSTAKSQRNHFGAKVNAMTFKQKPTHSPMSTLGTRQHTKKKLFFFRSLGTTLQSQDTLQCQHS